MSNIIHVSSKKIIPGPNDRTTFHSGRLRELADSIAMSGLLNAITVRRLADDTYEIVAGERRFRAVQLLGWEDVPCRVVEMSDLAASLAMLAENVGRADLDPIDEARGYARRMEQFDLTPEEIAEKAGVSAVVVRNRVALLRLRDELANLVRTGDLSVGYAKVLADALLDPNRQLIAFRRLRDNPSPTVGWFRSVCMALAGEQARETLFDLPLFGDEAIPMPTAKDPVMPPLPSTHMPPRPKGAFDPYAAMLAHADYWDKAAEAWDALGKVFKRKECQAAATALRRAAEAWQPAMAA